ncbi:MAG TPA: flagellar M-ring protein FliF C-terminal domain-containing protein, partial [Polyangiaceae bacterium]
AASASAMVASLPAPQVAANTQKGLPAGMMRESHTRNFEIDHVSDKRVLGPGALRRLTVAVVVDGIETTVDGKTTTTERSPEQMAKIASLVRGAVGIDDKRGDILTVETVPFLAAPADPSSAVAIDAPKPFDLAHFDYKAHAKLLAGVGGSAFLLFMLAGLSLRKRSKKAAAAKALALAEAEKAKALQFGPAPVPAQIEITPKTPEDVRQAAHERAMMDPATAALVLKAWLGAGENEEKMAIAS